MPRKRTIPLQAATKLGKLELVTKYASKRGKFRGRKAALILPELKAFVIAMALPGEELIEPVMEYLGIGPLGIIPNLELIPLSATDC